jgi:hypothetical protein
MELIKCLVNKQKEIEKEIKEELLYMGIGKDNSAYIDRLSDQMLKISLVIDDLYILHSIPRKKVAITPYAYLNKLSQPDELVPFILKLDFPCKNPIGLFDEDQKLLAIE